MHTSDRDLLRQYTERRSQDAFTALVHRHVNLVYSTALRLVRSPHLAEEVAQSVFADLANQAARLAPDTVLPSLLYQVARRTAIDVVRRESRRQLREQVAYELSTMNATAAEWNQVEPLLDEAMHALDETDRVAILLRFFENKSLREVGQALGTSDDAAQKRVSRAVERLREFFIKRGVAVGAAGITAVISANAVQASPAGLAATISSAIALAGTTTIATTTTATVAKTIAMTTLQKTLIAATLAVTVSATLYEAHQTSTLRDELQTSQNHIQALQEEQAPLHQQIQELSGERDNAKNQLATVTAENDQWKATQKSAALSKSQGGGDALSQSTGSDGSESGKSSTSLAQMMNDPKMKEYIHQTQLKMIKERYAALFAELNLTPDDVEKFTQLIGDKWMKVTDLGPQLASGNTDAASKEQAMSKAYKENDDQLQSLLGPTGFVRYNEFTHEIPARSTVTLLNNQLGSSPLTDDQSARLIDIVKAEPYTATHGINGEMDPAFFGSQDDIDKYVKLVTDANQRILDQAASFLTPVQLSALAAVQNNSLTAQKLQGAALTQKH